MNDTDLDLDRTSVDADFGTFVRSRTPALLRAAYLLTGDRHLAEDLVQSALARTHLSWRRLRDSANAEAYTRRVMYHHQVSFWRRRRPAESLPGYVPDQAGPADPVSHVDTRVAVRAALDRLTSRQRAVLILRYFEDRSEAETAEILQVSVGTVKSQTSHALSRMRALAPELASIAGEVEITDLEPRVRRTSTRLRRRRSGTAAVAALVAVLAIVSAVNGFWHRADVPPTDPWPSPSTSTSPSPSPSASGGGLLPPPTGRAAAFSCPAVSTVSRPSANISTTVYFWSWDDTHACAVLNRLDGGQVRAVATVPFGQGYGPMQTVALSPDGTRIVWIANDDTSLQAGDLAVAPVGGTARVLGGGASYEGGTSPIWEADSRHVLVKTNDGDTFRIDTTTGTGEPAQTMRSYLTYSTNGAFMAYGETGHLVVKGSDGTPKSDTVYSGPDPQCRCRFSVQGVSDDGRYVVVGRGNTDPSRVLGGYAVVDARTGAQVTLAVKPPAGSQITQVVFRPGGGMLVVTESGEGVGRRVYLVSAAGAITEQVAVPELVGVVVHTGN